MNEKTDDTFEQYIHSQREKDLLTTLSIIYFRRQLSVGHANILFEVEANPLSMSH